jgi:hypothetical protein
VVSIKAHTHTKQVVDQAERKKAVQGLLDRRGGLCNRIIGPSALFFIMDPSLSTVNQSSSMTCPLPFQCRCARVR